MCRACDREWNAAARERAKAAPKPAPSKVREKPCKRGHGIELSTWGDDGRWHCKGCQRFHTKRWAAENPDKRKANQAVQDERRRVRRKAAAMTEDEKILRRLAEGSRSTPSTGCREWSGKRRRITWQGRAWLAYMLAWHLHHGEVPPGRTVTQVCGNPRCIEPSHLAALDDDQRGLLKLELNSRVDQVTGCREFTGHLTEGYGHVWHGGRGWTAHRLSWTLLRGSIPSGMVIDHLCRNRRCIEPRHLRVTDFEGNNRNVGKPETEPLATLWDRYAKIPGLMLTMG